MVRSKVVISQPYRCNYGLCVYVQGHYRRAAVLAKQGQWREAIASYLLCLHLGVKCYRSVVDAACQVKLHMDSHCVVVNNHLPLIKTLSSCKDSVKWVCNSEEYPSFVGGRGRGGGRGVHWALKDACLPKPYAP